MSNQFGWIDKRRGIRVDAGLVDPNDIHAKTPLREHLADHGNDARRTLFAVKPQ
jgi:hypothetical protein